MTTTDLAGTVETVSSGSTKPALDRWSLCLVRRTPCGTPVPAHAHDEPTSTLDLTQRNAFEMFASEAGSKPEVARREPLLILAPRHVWREIPVFCLL